MKGPVEKKISIKGDVQLTYFEWGEKKKETILMVHATGFHARCWDKVIEQLGDVHVIALDMRGHGRSEKIGPYAWDVFGTDVAAFVESLGLENIIAVGHSMGGHSVTRAAADLPGKFTQLILIDPVIMSPEFYKTSKVNRQLFPDGHPVAKRRYEFADAQTMFENFVGRGSYASWQSEVLMDYCTYGLLPDPAKNGFILACPPEVEATIYMENTDSDLLKKLACIKIPVKVLRAKARELVDDGKMDFTLSPTWPELASQFEFGEDIYLSELTHFIPMQAPELTAHHIKSCLDR